MNHYFHPIHSSSSSSHTSPLYPTTPVRRMPLNELEQLAKSNTKQLLHKHISISLFEPVSQTTKFMLSLSIYPSSFPSISPKFYCTIFTVYISIISSIYRRPKPFVHNVTTSQSFHSPLPVNAQPPIYPCQSRPSVLDLARAHKTDFTSMNHARERVPAGYITSARVCRRR
jgi:hypothetical protein